MNGYSQTLGLFEYSPDGVQIGCVAYLFVPHNYYNR